MGEGQSKDARIMELEREILRRTRGEWRRESQTTWEGSMELDLDLYWDKSGPLFFQKKKDCKFFMEQEN